MVDFYSPMTFLSSCSVIEVVLWRPFPLKSSLRVPARTLLHSLAVGVPQLLQQWQRSVICGIFLKFVVFGYTALYLQIMFLLLCLCSQISAISFASYLSDRKRFKNFFRTDPSAENFVPGLFSVLQYYGWHKVHFLTQRDRLFTDVSACIRFYCEDHSR